MCLAITELETSEDCRNWFTDPNYVVRTQINVLVGEDRIFSINIDSAEKKIKIYLIMNASTY